MIIEETHETSYGVIRYWISEQIDSEKVSLLFLPGLTADHRLFDKQMAYFQSLVNVFVWDPPAHATSWPFEFGFSLMDKAKWIDEIIEKHHLPNPVIVGQSMGGYVGQAYAEAFPNKLKGFISIDSAPLQRHYMNAFEIWCLRHVEPIYKYYPWKALLQSGTKGVATTEYGRNLMREMMEFYREDQARYAQIAGRGFQMLADAIDADLPYLISCPALLICGEEDRAGSAKKYNKLWHKETGIPIAWIKNAGHNANTDAPDEINALIENFIGTLSLQ